VVTTRPIPPELASTSFDDGHSTSKNDSHHPSLKTIDPSLLDRPQDSTLTGAQKKTADLLEASLQGRNHTSTAQRYATAPFYPPYLPVHTNLYTCSLTTVEPRKLGVQSNDVLSKARELGIKIWALEKLQRMMTTMFDTDTGEQPDQRRNIASTLRRGEKADLQTLLRNEKVIGPADRDLAVAAQDSVQFRGYYIYVHDMDERTRPVMVRDYPKVTHKEEGKWPQFRLTPIGRCPFVEDPSHTKKLRLAEEVKTAEAEKERKLAAGAPVTRSRAASGTGLSQSTTSQPKELAEAQNKDKKTTEVVDDHVKPLDPPKGIPNKRQTSMDTGSMPALFGSTQANMRGAPRFIGGEPVASGVQPSNITSAIRSQIVSSTISSTAPGTRNVGASKEITALKRRALERGASANSNEPLQSSYLTDMRAAINGDRQPAPRAAKRKAQETLGHIREEGEEGQAKSRRAQQVRKKVVVEREMKAGYCENCRDKFEDFDIHCQSRKHRKFAMDKGNWSQLDDLLNQLERPLK
jgi:regulatory subunit for Cdc7p protein kinase